MSITLQRFKLKFGEKSEKAQQLDDMLLIRKISLVPKKHNKCTEIPNEAWVTVDVEHIYTSKNRNQKITISWNLTTTPNIIDCIGLFDLETSLVLEYLDYRCAPFASSSNGNVSWLIHSNIIPEHVHTVYFGFIDGITGSLIARSEPIPIVRSASLVLKDIELIGQADFSTLHLSVDALSHTVDINKLKKNISFPFREYSFLYFTIDDKSVSLPIAEIERLNSDLSITLPLWSSTEEYSLLMSFVIQPTHEEEPSNIMKKCTMSNSLSTVSSMSQTSSSSSSSSNYSNPAPANLTTPLPRGWESCEDRFGRVFYIDHTTKKTTWTRPEIKAEKVETDDTTGKNRHCMSRRTVGLNPSPFCTSTAILFIQREDFTSILHENEFALSSYNNCPILRHIIHRIRKKNEDPQKFESQPNFVEFVNSFADQTQPLPPKWQQIQQKPVLFIDHGRRQTTLLDPRLPTGIKEERRRGRSVPAPQRREQVDSNGNLFDIVSRRAELEGLIERRMPHLAPKIRKKLRIIERLGHIALNRMANDVDLITAISILDVDDSPEISELEEKIQHFYSSLHRSGYGNGPAKIKMRFGRSSLLRDAFDQILSIDSGHLKKSKLSIEFDEEDGIDYGGPSRELFFLLSRDLFNPYYGLFQYSSDDKYTVQINRNSASHVENDMRWMELSGRIIGLALLHRCLIDTFFTNIFYKTLLGESISLLDICELDSEFYNSLVWIRENSVTADLAITFVAVQHVNGQVQEYELLPNGNDLYVNDSNKEEFISLMIKWKTEKCVERQQRALLRGLHQIIDRDFLRVFNAEELQLVLSGTLEINLDDWRTHTEYKGGYHDSHVVIEWFWDLLEQLSNAERLKLLQFVTGTSSVPFEGFSMLRGSNGIKRFTIEKWGEENCLPRAHTCFNRLDLPCYATKHILKSKMLLAINDGLNYGIE